MFLDIFQTLKLIHKTKSNLIKMIFH